VEAVLKGVEHHLEWVFSGVGVAAVVGLFSLFRRRRTRHRRRGEQVQRGGDFSMNIQSGRDTTLNK
jgi:nitrate reductase gamma subunit